MFHFLYQLGIGFYGWGIRLAALFLPKAQQLRRGRSETLGRLAAFVAQHPGRHKVWVHCASLGEFEQGRPLIEALKARWPDRLVVLSFFSPSGYEVRQHYPLADLVCYLPADTARNAQQFVGLLKPELAVFVKYEFWQYYLRALHAGGVPTFLIAGIFRPGHLFFQWYGQQYGQVLGCFSHLFLQDEASAALLRGQGLTHFCVVGDNRIDRVLAIAEQAAEFPLVAGFVGSAPVLIAGSTWPADEALLLPFLQAHLPPSWRSIIAPHEIKPHKIAAIEAALPGRTVRYSALKQGVPLPPEADVLIVDNVGMLAALYRYGRLAYIGGGHGSGLHNTLEPAAFGLPLMFGPRFQKFEEARNFVAAGGAVPVRTVQDMAAAFQLWQDETAWEAASQSLRQYLLSHQGATERVLGYVAGYFEGGEGTQE